MENNTNISQVSQTDIQAPIIDNPNLTKNKEIKCGNCNYIGPGEKNRSLIAVILAWICIIIAPIITLIYFTATHTWKCPKCQSTFVGVKNKKGIYTGQLGGGLRIFLIILFVLIGIAILGIFSSVVLASLNSARTRSSDATVKSAMSNLRVQSLLYEDKVGTFKGFCQDSATLETLKTISKAGASNEFNYACNDSEKNWAISSPLRSGDYWCVDGSENMPKNITTALSTQTSCSNTGNNSLKENLIKQLVDEIKSSTSFPSKVDENTAVTDIKAESSAVHYYFSLSGVDTSKITNSNLKSFLLNGVCKNEGVKMMLNNDININQTYLDTETSKTFSVSFSKGDCK